MEIKSTFNVFKLYLPHWNSVNVGKCSCYVLIFLVLSLLVYLKEQLTKLWTLIMGQSLSYKYLDF